MTLNGRAVKTTCEAHHACRHRAHRTAASRDLAAKRTAERAGYARRLATRDCAECSKAGPDATAAWGCTTWLTGRQAEELAQTEPWETRAAMPALDGSDKAVDWGRRVRHQLLVAAHATLGLAEEDFAVRVDNPARRIDSASWWSFPSRSSQRDTEPGDLEEQGGDAAFNDTVTTSRNPY